MLIDTKTNLTSSFVIYLVSLLTEAIDIVETILDNDWINANTSDRKPLIDEIDDVNNPQVTSNQDYVLLYEAGNADDYPGLNLCFKDQNWIVSIEIRTASKNQRRLIDKEIVRILDANNKTLGSGFSWLTTTGRRDTIQDKKKPLYVMVRDVKVEKQSVVL